MRVVESATTAIVPRPSGDMIPDQTRTRAHVIQCRGLLAASEGQSRARFERGTVGRLRPQPSDPGITGNPARFWRRNIGGAALGVDPRLGTDAPRTAPPLRLA